MPHFDFNFSLIIIHKLPKMQHSGFIIFIVSTLFIAFLHPAIQAVDFHPNHHVLSDYAEDAENKCKDEAAESVCQKIVNSGRCSSTLDFASIACKKSCNLCLDEDGYDLETRKLNRAGASCADVIPFCAQYSGSIQPLCCAAVEFFNATCPKSCNFCMEVSLIPTSPIGGLPSLPGAGSATTPSVVTQQNPCNPTQMPTGSVNPGSG